MTDSNRINEKLALLGGPRAVTVSDDVFAQTLHWPIVTEEDEQAVLEVMRSGNFSSGNITRKFEAEYATWQGSKFAMASSNGTMALLQAMFAVGLGRGDEMIVPSLTYWASALQSMSLGSTPVFADIEPDSLCIDPASIEKKITSCTKAIMVVHYCGHPCDMDPIMAIANKHHIAVIEDVSHAHGTLYKGRKVGTFGKVAAMSMMGIKSFAIGEAGMLVTDDREAYERAIAFGCYERCDTELTIEPVRSWSVLQGTNFALPLGGIKARMNQTCAAMGRVQLKYYDARVAEIQKAMNHFWDLLEGTPGLRPHRPTAPKFENSTMGGWYNPLGHYLPEELGGLPIDKFIEALSAEGARGARGANRPLHTHPVFNDADIYHDGKPTCNAFTDRDVRQTPSSLPVSNNLNSRALGVPWFKHDHTELIEQVAAAYRKVSLQAESLAAHC